MRRDQLTILVSLVLFGATFAVFNRVLVADFVQWDDDINIYDNPHIQGLNASNLRWIFTTCEYPPRYAPLYWLGWAINCQLGGLNPSGFHLTDLLFHAANASLVFLLIRRLLLLATSKGAGGEPNRRIWFCSALAALLWAAHPFRVESVAWAAGRTYVQSFFFLMLSALCYLRFQTAPAETGRGRFYWISLFCFAASLLSYPIGLTFVVVLVVLDFYPLRRFKPGLAGLWDAAAVRIWLEKVPYALVAALVLAATLLLRASNNRLGPPPSLEQFGIGARAMQALYVWAYYVWKPCLPFHLSPVYTTLANFDPSAWPFWLSAVFVAGATMLLLCRCRQWPWALALWLCHLALLVPMLGLTEHPHSTSDRYGYLPGLTWSVLIAAALWRLSSRPRLFAAAAACAAALAMFWAALSLRQVRVWQNSETLFTHMLRELGNHPCAQDIHWRLGGYFARQGKTDAAVQHYQTSLQILPTAKTYAAFARLMETNGLAEAALTNYLGLLQLNPNAATIAKVGGLLSNLGRTGEANSFYRTTLIAFPNLAPELNNLAWQFVTDPDATNRNGTEAVRLAQIACALTEHQIPVLVGTLAAAYAEAGRFKEAIETAQQARALAEAAGQPEVAEKNRQLLELYRSGRPCREPPGLPKSTVPGTGGGLK